MKKNKFVTGLSLIIFGVIWGWGVAYAKGDNSTPDQINNSDQIQSRNSRHKMPHSDRKASAVRLRQSHGQQHQQQLQGIAKLEIGYTGNGQRGEQ
ncbi:hypothetical protein [Methylobacter sp. S3L5C]|uniref:hypothetical protein n=1 Tax=Methylobacter sp. S3L5C TaxID=2839024 RepID=UPI001FACC08B|nr:hypothetical protein [Methylobacter sp. S3L5C]UOA07308.1 hypothetical protein KKZ03_13550 [Methylobacter sp. S3L5C]